MVFVYCRTDDAPLTVGEIICRANSVDGLEARSWILREMDDDGSCVVEVKCVDSAVAVVYSVGKMVVGVEIEDECASRVIEPLLDKYGFENVKWLLAK